MARSPWWSDGLQMWKTELQALVGRTPSHTTLKFRDQTICSLRHLCFCIQQTFIENILHAREGGNETWSLSSQFHSQVGKNRHEFLKIQRKTTPKTLNYVYGARSVERNVWPSLGNLRLIKAAVFEWGLDGWVGDSQVKKEKCTCGWGDCRGMGSEVWPLQWAPVCRGWWWGCTASRVWRKRVEKKVGKGRPWRVLWSRLGTWTITRRHCGAEWLQETL